MKFTTPLLAAIAIMATGTTALPTTQQTTVTSISASSQDQPSSIPSHDQTNPYKPNKNLHTPPGLARSTAIQWLGDSENVDQWISRGELNDVEILKLEDILELEKRDGVQVVKVKRMSWDKFWWCATHNEDDSCPWGMKYNPFFTPDSFGRK